MSVLAKDREIELVVTWVCNWRCEYCCVDTHNRPTLSMDKVKQKLEQVPNGYNVTLSGGEVGTMKRTDIEYILNRLKEKNCTVSINTNGFFIKRYRDLCDQFEEILYHCSENLDITDDIIIDPALPIQYLLVVTDNNFSKLGDFLSKYPDIQFNLVAASNPAGIYGPTLSTALKHRMLTLYSSRMTTESKLRVFNEKEFDRITYL